MSAEKAAKMIATINSSVKKQNSGKLNSPHITEIKTTKRKNAGSSGKEPNFKAMHHDATSSVKVKTSQLSVDFPKGIHCNKSDGSSPYGIGAGGMDRHIMA